MPLSTVLAEPTRGEGASFKAEIVWTIAGAGKISTSCVAYLKFNAHTYSSKAQLYRVDCQPAAGAGVRRQKRRLGS